MAICVLVVEDDEMVADVVRLALELEGFDVAHVMNAEAALSTIAVSPPDLVLLDIMLPEVDGWEVLSSIRAHAHTRRIPVIVMTAKTMPADQVRAYNLGASGYLMKPFSPDEVVAKVTESLHDARPV